MSRVLITGGCGFIGSHLTDQLVDQNKKIFIIDNLSTGKLVNLNRRASFINSNIEDQKIYNLILKIKPDFIFHLAAQTSIAKSLLNPRDDFETNLISMTPILEAAVKLKIKKFVFSSSAAIYGDSKDVPIVESCPKNPYSPYGIAKLSAEYLIYTYNKSYALPFVIFRYSNVYGPRQSSSQEGGVVSIFINNGLNGQKLTINGDGNQTRDFVFVSDVVKANLIAAKLPIQGTFNVSTATNLSINSLADKILKITKSDSQIEYAKPKYMEVRKSSLSFESFNKVSKWYPQINIDSGLQQTVQFFNKK